MIDAGANLVVVETATAPLGVEVYRDRAIIYGLGPLVGGAPAGRYAVLVEATIGPDGVKVLSLVPLTLADGLPSGGRREFGDFLGNDRGGQAPPLDLPPNHQGRSRVGEDELPEALVDVLEDCHVSQAELVLQT